MTNNQTKCGIIYGKIAMRAGDDKRMITCEWPKKGKDSLETRTVLLIFSLELEISWVVV